MKLVEKKIMGIGCTEKAEKGMVRPCVREAGMVGG
jgi:hypothetical protein